MLWGNIDYTTGNNKPLYANTSNTTSNSSINGTSANTDKFYGIVAGVSADEEERSNNTPQHPVHAGWVSLKIGTGPVSDVTITSRGTGINANGFIVVTDTATDSTANGYGVGTGANISFTIANTQNLLQTFSSNSAWNGIGTLTVVNGGSGYSNVSKITYAVSNAANTTQPVLSIILGGRAGRIQTETLVAMGSITLDAPSDNAYYTGI
jgi:hypothetical protein